MANDLSIYSRYAPHWWDDSVRFLRILRNLVPARFEVFDRVDPHWTGVHVLDLGCAGGFMSEALARRGANVTGLDPAREALAIAHEHAAAEGLDIQYVEGVGEALPFGDASFDRVVCVDVLEHVRDVGRVIAEIARVLRPGGLFFFDTIDRSWFSRLVVVEISERLGFIPRGTHEPSMFIRPSELEAMLRANGLEPGPLTGIAPKGITRRLDFEFGPVASTALVYAGHAEKATGTGRS